MIDQPAPGIPVYTVKSLTGDKTKVLHRNLLLPCEVESGRKVRQWRRESQTLRQRRKKEL